ncbi:MAG TPA: sugar phosphate isomerase/epimerase, partial [Terriglobia bacterium]|nr:sugar phosphate isomerase/epimerase [Terriglobia bacterium]
MNRRDAGKAMLGGAAAMLARPLLATQWIDSVVRGVQIGAQSYSFRDRPLDACIQAYVTVGLGECELSQGHVEPAEDSGDREKLRKWRLNTPLSYFQDVRKKFDAAGVRLYAYNYSFRHDMTEAEMRRGFEMTKALGLRYITASSNVSLAP